MNIFIATQNDHKIKEITQILFDISFSFPDTHHNIPEKTYSYIENALIKAKYWSKLYPTHYILADDSGLEVQALNNGPGVISSDWAGKNAPQTQQLSKLLTALNDIPFEQRTAQFVSYILLLSPDQNIFVSRGECVGRIALCQSGQEGFGFDPLFLPVEYCYEKTFAELLPHEKNKISHRSRALIGLKNYIQYIRMNNEPY